jgi:4-hydroxyphenylpyruvate dioxygenase
MKRSQLAINSISTGGANLEERLTAYRAAGFENIEFFLGHIHEYLDSGHTVGDIADLLARTGTAFIGGFIDAVKAFAPESERLANHKFIIDNARLIADLGGGNLVVGTDGPAGQVDDPTAILAATFAELAAQIPPEVNLLIEFNWGPIVKSLSHAADIARRSGAPNVGVLFDPAHYHCTPTKFDQLTPENVALIKHVHVNDMRDKPGELSNCNADRVLPGEGILNLSAIFGRIEECGYRGLFSIEMFDDDLIALPVAEAAARLYAGILPLCDKD